MITIDDRLTFEKLLAGIFGVESIMLDRTRTVLNHEFEDRHNFLFGVAGVMGDCGILWRRVSKLLKYCVELAYPFATFEELTRHIHRGCS